MYLLKFIIGKFNFVNLNKLERPLLCLFKGAIFKWRILKWFPFVSRALILLIIKSVGVIRMQWFSLSKGRLANVVKFTFITIKSNNCVSKGIP